MKKPLIILLAFIFLGCNQHYKKKDLLGTWDIVSSIDIESGEVEFLKGDDEMAAVFKSDSLYLFDNYDSDKYFAWRIKGDSLILEDGIRYFNIYIKELTKDKLVVEYDFLGIVRLELKKSSKHYNIP